MTSTSSRFSVQQRTIDVPSSRRRRVVVFGAATAITGIGALALGMWLGGNLTESQINGLAIGGTGNFTGWGLPASKLVMDVASIGVIGLLLACLLLPEHDGEPTATARRCLRTASRLALVWSVATAALLIFSWSDVVARPVTDLPFTKLFTDTVRTFPDAADYVSTTALALVIAAALAITQTRRGALLLLPLAVYNIVPMALQGHASHSTALKYSLIVHVIAMSLWVGGLLALLTHVRGEPALLAVAVPRFSSIALGCYATVAASGVVAAWELLGAVSAVWETRYGVVVTLKVAALITLGILGWWHRRHTVRRIRTGEGGRPRRAFVQLAAAEIVVMVGAVAIGVALSRSASPDTILLHTERGTTASVERPAPAPGTDSGLRVAAPSGQGAGGATGTRTP
ncbi:MAG TPA: CopD family protein [Streptosporangiaceae bacterium]|nr:CopD family protein [Streptosporangiaceae bacterium]